MLIRQTAPELTLVAPRFVVPGSGTTPPVPGSSGAPVALLAGSPVSGHRALMFDGAGGAVHADPSQPDFAFAGISAGAASQGAPVQAVETGLLSEPGWSWTPKAPVFVGAGGVLTQTPPVSGVLQQVAVAVSPTSIFVQPQPSILLA